MNILTSMDWYSVTVVGQLNSIERNEPPQCNFPAVGLSWSVNPLIMITLHSVPLQFIDAGIVSTQVQQNRVYLPNAGWN